MKNRPEDIPTDPIERALKIALEAHRDQKDKYGQPYILHPLRIMTRFRDPMLQLIAILHDVVEDSDWTGDQLISMGFTPEVVEAVEALTRQEGESYKSLIDRAAAHPLAILVKLGDLEDNMDIHRMKDITEKDRERLNRYRTAYAKLSAISSQQLHTL